MTLRPQIKWFAGKMESKLKKNDHKGGWEGEDVIWLLKRAEEELEELKEILDESEALACNVPNFVDKDKIISEAADVANFLMMIADRISIEPYEE